MRSGKQVNILMVDDRPENLLSLTAVLEPLGAELLSADSGPRAIELASVHDLSVVILDVSMPGMDGFEAARRLRELDGMSEVPILFVTAMDVDAQQIALAYSLGAVDFIAKPFSADALRAKVLAYTRLSDRTRELQAQLEEVAADDEPDILVTNPDVAHALLAERVTTASGRRVNVVFAPSGRSALAQLLTRTFALILIDIDLPDMSGFDVALMLRQDERCRGIPLVLVATTEHTQVETNRGYSIGAVDLIFWPLEPAILCGKVRSLLDQFWQHRVLASHVQEVARLHQALQISADELAHANATLEERVRQRTAELAAANLEISHIASHDPLTGLPNRTVSLAFSERLRPRFPFR